jgi:hypothetical protein
MGFAVAQEYETLKGETQSGAVEHNEWVGPAAERLPSERKTGTPEAWNA